MNLLKSGQCLNWGEEVGCHFISIKKHLKPFHFRLFGWNTYTYLYIWIVLLMPPIPLLYFSHFNCLVSFHIFT